MQASWPVDDPRHDLAQMLQRNAELTRELAESRHNEVQLLQQMAALQSAADQTLISVKQEATEAIQLSEMRFQSFLDQNPIAAYIKDEDGRYIFVNRAMELRFDRQPADCVGRTDFDLFPSSDAERYRQSDLSVLHSQQAAQFHETSPGSAGWQEYLEFKFPMQDSTGRWLIAGTAVDITRQARAEASLAASEQQLRALASQITKVERLERQRLASILHEDVQQLLIAMQMRVATLAASSNDRSVKEQAPVLNELLSAAIRAVRTLSRDLVPPALHQLGLPAGLKWLAQRFKERHCLAVTVAAEDDADPRTSALRDVLFQCARELLLNVVKHARTEVAEVHLFRRIGQLILTVEDRGVGLNFDSDNEPTDTFGLFQLRERLSPLGGTLEVCGGAKQGVVATVTLPVLGEFSAVPVDNA